MFHFKVRTCKDYLRDSAATDEILAVPSEHKNGLVGAVASRLDQRQLRSANLQDFGRDVERRDHKSSSFCLPDRRLDLLLHGPC